MPSNMAMHQPRPWIIRLKRQSKIPATGQQRCIPSGRVIEFKVPGRVDWIVRFPVLVEDYKIRAVEVDGVPGGDGGEVGVWVEEEGAVYD